jgi:hypothetical protein
VLGTLIHLCLQECDPTASECDSSVLHREVASSGSSELQAGGACYS